MMDKQQEDLEIGQVDEDNEQEMMMAMLGFGGFNSTKGAHVKGNVTGAANVTKEVTYRQVKDIYNFYLLFMLYFVFFVFYAMLYLPLVPFMAIMIFY